MNSLYLENSIIGSLFRFFSPYFSTATRMSCDILIALTVAWCRLLCTVKPIIKAVT